EKLKFEDNVPEPQIGRNTVLIGAVLLYVGRLAPPAILSSSAMVSDGISSVAAARFSRRWPTDDVPGMRSMLGARCRSHASATCIGVARREAAAALSSADCSGENPPSGK